MARKPIVVGVDASEPAARAAALGWRMAEAEGTKCRLVHAARDPWAAFATLDVPERATLLTAAQLDQEREQICTALRDAVPAAALNDLVVRVGGPATVLSQEVERLGAGVVVLGGKNHSALGRWFGGSTSVNVVRTTLVPVLVTAGTRTTFRRVLAAVDLSDASGPTLDRAQEYADLFGATLRAISVFEPLPTIPEAFPINVEDYYRLEEDLLRQEVWPRVRRRGAETLVRYGMTVDTLLREVAEWPADLLVVGSHGRGWAERMLLGSVTERLLNHLPTSLLVVPVRSAKPLTAKSLQTAGAR
jgi:nucleotide-binding universal stress UspA family protein